METRSASLFSGAHSDEVDYVAWNPTHPELFCSSSQKDRRIAFWDARRMSRARTSRSAPV
jgi:THO complex subunit 3